MSKYTSLQSFSEHNAQIVALPEIPDQEPAPDPQTASLEEKLAWITDKVPLKEGNVMGSQAGAGSGDFHQYRMARRREQLRWLHIEEEEHQRLEKEAFEERKRDRETAAEDKTSKNRNKRQKRKEKKLAKQGSSIVGPALPEGPPTAGPAKTAKEPEVDID
mmetsp:Transcript_523/g.596  ORF Transcript_523/g.596 Transcript_523/m.596 type:complete len:161 (+) Transcript_523:194-676(+)|eukprot:CAMPEP_0197862876 /NCGR_PEP_ID=MMETSP1438-20131217/39955_1 /TAXON_ID=1461541 /ORGANISM="Pterosperma sp., Strain CCMP1384" /LENGTH=160 /DNA_ID=CAMNT_0043480581 /DNA_START=184 /DNA_END=666 /DNA_ORIENTATION=-